MTNYRPAPAVERIASDLIGKHHRDLDGVRIEYVFRETAAKKAGKHIWGQARKVSGLNAYLATDTTSDVVDVDDFFVIEIAEDIWAELNDQERIALVDHELCHCVAEVDEDAETITLRVAPHDVEEFRVIVERHGLWRGDVEHFAESVKAHFDQLVDDGLV
jgi:predicted metallopeptidase